MWLFYGALGFAVVGFLAGWSLFITRKRSWRSALPLASLALAFVAPAPLIGLQTHGVLQSRANHAFLDTVSASFNERYGKTVQQVNGAGPVERAYFVTYRNGDQNHVAVYFDGNWIDGLLASPTPTPEPTSNAAQP